jgi:DNA-binding response OmpR family regulator
MPPLPMNSPRILIADDDRELVGMLTLRCRQLGVTVETAYDALTALNCMRSRTPDLVCLDVNMPSGNGLSACEMLASEPAWATIPVIILTGRTDPETIMRCHQLCAYYVLKGGEIWLRVEPLIRELLPIGNLATVIPV